MNKSKHDVFRFNTLDELKEKIDELEATIKLSDDFSVFHKTVNIGKKAKAPNSFAVLPMEGCDSNPDGSPSELVKRRYKRFAGGGAGLLWWEACAVVPEGRANPLQMMLTDDNAKAFEDLLKLSNKEGADKNGAVPVNILQLTHSGRYSRPMGEKPMPLIPQHDPVLDPLMGIDGNTELLSDAYLESLVEKYAHAAELAVEVGFDGVDIKACHRYLLSELLACHTRQGKYGGSFENRVRLLTEIIGEVRKSIGEEHIVACRFNALDAHPYPYGFGGDKEDFMTFDPEEPMELVRLLCSGGVDLLSNSAGNPYYIYPQVTRPFDKSSDGIPVPWEHPLESMSRLFDITRQIQKAAGEIPVVGNGYSWLRQFIPYAGAANLADGSCKFVGLGRSSFAYPAAPSDILTGKGMEVKQCCIACSKCTQIMRDHGKTGCVVRDGQIYSTIYKEVRR